MPQSIRYTLFDTAVNSGVVKAVKLLQAAVGEAQDGVLGPHTLLASSSMSPERLAARFIGWRLDFMNDLPTWGVFGRGWTQRLADILKEI
jgi:lysozyme family protein